MISSLIFSFSFLIELILESKFCNLFSCCLLFAFKDSIVEDNNNLSTFEFVEISIYSVGVSFIFIYEWNLFPWLFSSKLFWNANGISTFENEPSIGNLNATSFPLY